MNNITKALFPEGVETITISKNDYDRLYGELTYQNIQLQSNWNSLRDWLETLKDSSLYSLSFKEPLINVLDKMNELERKDKE